MIWDISNKISYLETVTRKGIDMKGENSHENIHLKPGSPPCPQRFLEARPFEDHKGRENRRKEQKSLDFDIIDCAAFKVQLCTA
jgi:hypothetical protein